MKRTTTISTSWRGFLAAAILSAPLVAGAVPAKPGLYTMETPDGGVIRFERVGGERNHAIYSEDGLMLSMLEDGSLVYAVPDANGLPSPSSIKAHAPEFRTASEKNFISGISQTALRAAMERNVAQADGFKAMPARVMAKAPSANPGQCTNTMPVNTGSPKCLVVLVEFQDEKFRTANAGEYFNNSINQPGFDSGEWVGSVSDYFKENSMGQYTPQFDVYGPVTLSKKVSYYGGNDSQGNDQRPHEMVTEACTILDETTDINFADYDNDGDGCVDNVFVYFAGFGEANSMRRPNTVWPHSHDLSVINPSKKYYFDDVRIDHYACTNEVHELYPGSENFRVEGIATFVHEFSHVLGLPDLYETSYATGSYTPGAYSVLDNGVYNNDGHTPPNYGAFERYALGWMKPIEFYDTKEYTLEPIVDTNVAYMIQTPRENEYYLFENRRLEGWDKFIPNEGMLVYHVDFVQSVFDYNIVNNQPSHQYVDLIEADNIRTTDTAAGDVFPGTKNVTSFGFNTVPQLASWKREDLQREFTEIRQEGRNVLFTMTNTDPDYKPGSGVDNVATVTESESVAVVAGKIVSTYGVALGVYDTMGRKAGEIAPASSLSLPAGIYLVATPQGSMKVRL